MPADFTPPPGAYAPDNMKMEVGNSQDRTVGVLHSKTKRFKPAKPQIGPGPGDCACYSC